MKDSFLRRASGERELPATLAPGLDLFDEEALTDEIGRQLQERLSHRRASRIEAQRLALASIIAAKK
jgi:hypothetical protein